MADNTKTRLIGELDRARGGLSRDWSRLREAADVPAHLRQTFVHHKAAWLGGAALVGWVISRLPARKKKVKVLVDAKGHTVKRIAEGGLLLGLGKIAFSAIRPAVTAVVTRKLREYFENRMERRG